MTKLLDDLETELDQYQLTLQKSVAEGIQLHGAESKKRELLSQLMVNNLNSTSVYSVIENHLYINLLTSLNWQWLTWTKYFKLNVFNGSLRITSLLFNRIKLFNLNCTHCLKY